MSVDLSAIDQYVTGPGVRPNMLAVWERLDGDQRNLLLLACGFEVDGEQVTPRPPGAVAKWLNSLELADVKPVKDNQIVRWVADRKGRRG